MILFFAQIIPFFFAVLTILFGIVLLVSIIKKLI